MHKNIAYGAIGTALSVIFLALASYLPSGKAALVFASSLSVFCVFSICGSKTALTSYVASSLIAFFITMASPQITVSFIICFGNYPVLSRLLLSKPIGVKILIKAILYAVYFALAYAVFKLIFPVNLKYSYIILFLGGAVLFALYDVLLDYTGRYAVSLIEKQNFFLK